MTRMELTGTSAALATGIGALALLASPAWATLVHTGDSTIDGSLCVGFDCASNEPMGFSTIKIEENNLRISAADSSSIGSFPTRDWQIEFNSSSNGGGSYFMIRDCGNSGAADSVSTSCGGTPMLTIEAGADNDSIYVNSSGNQGGNVGFGTTNPVVDLHAVSGNTPSLRLEQDGSSGFTPQTWDVAGNEVSFFIRDATSGSTLPLRIRSGSPSSSLDVFPAGVSVGSSTVPTGKLHVRNGDGSLDGIRVTNSGTNANLLRLENTNAAATGVGFILDPSGGANFWQMTATANENIFRINRSGGNGTEFELNDLGNLTISGGLISSGGGGACTVGDPCDAVFDPSVYTVPSIADHAAEMWAKGYLPAVGPTEPDQPLNMTVKMLRMLNELEHAHIYIAELNNRVLELEAQLK